MGKDGSLAKMIVASRFYKMAEEVQAEAPKDAQDAIQYLACVVATQQCALDLLFGDVPGIRADYLAKVEFVSDCVNDARGQG